MFFYRLKNFIRVFFALTVVMVSLFLLFTVSVCQLSDCGGERVFYLDSPSSQGLRKSELGISDIFRVKGETIRFKTQDSKEGFLKETLLKYQAELLFSEKIGETISYYCYAKGLDGGIVLNGRMVNLHVVWKEGEAVLGTPIIFDGY